MFETPFQRLTIRFESDCHNVQLSEKDSARGAERQSAAQEPLGAHS
jgi:hypothetical protein